MLMNLTNYRIGIDVGLNSVGLAAIEVDDDATPINILVLESIIHDGGIDPSANKSAGTRKAISGSARRMRRLIRGRKQRLIDLDVLLANLGWPIVDLETLKDPWAPWQARLQLTQETIACEETRNRLLSIALRHMARHRGWRNPYSSVQSLKQVTDPSSYFEILASSVSQKLGVTPETTRELTVAELVSFARHLDIHEHTVEGNPDRRTGEIQYTTYFDVSRTLRGQPRTGRDGNMRSGLLESKIHQSDNVRELRKIWNTQDLSEASFDLIVNCVFQAKSPKGSAASRVGVDPLDSTQHRAEKASLAFQKYRILSILANLRVTEGDSKRPLSSSERQIVFDYLWQHGSDLTVWADVAKLMDIDRHNLSGTAAETADGERANSHPPYDVTSARIIACGIKELSNWWREAGEPDREAMIEVLSNGSGSQSLSTDHMERVASAQSFVGELPEDLIGKLESLKLPEGRAAYSVKTLRRLNDRMLATTDDVSSARQAVFRVENDWRPPADPIGMPVGNPAVDRVLKIVNRFLLSCEREWGTPQSVNIEHTRNGLMSEKQARLIDNENNQKFQRNQEMAKEIGVYLASQASRIEQFEDDSLNDRPDTALDSSTPGVTRDQIIRYRALMRQESKCLYCGTTILLDTLEMDHIIPRAGNGATNTQVNLAAVCRDCNHSKGKQPFAVWVDSVKRPEASMSEAIDRVQGFRFFGVENNGSDSNPRTYKARFRREVIERLQRTDYDDAIDARSIESVGWMANELHHRVEEYFNEKNRGTDRKTTVSVFRGWITSEARKAAGIQNRILLIGGNPGKNRLDRRHHAIDAATIAMIRQGAAQSLTVQHQVDHLVTNFDLLQVLVERDSMRRAFELSPDSYSQSRSDDGKLSPIWKSFKGTNPQLFDHWQFQMCQLAELIQDKLNADEVPVWEFLRLRRGNSQAHEDTVRKLVQARVGDDLSPELINRSATPQQWVALTRHPDYSKQYGLDADPSRCIRIGHDWLESTSALEFFLTGAGCLKVRGGYVELGASFHHGRIYRCIKHSKSSSSSFYAMLRVYQVDLIHANNQDLFTVDIPPQAISWRSAEKRLRDAFDRGEAEYIGWIVQGDELRLTMESQTKGQISEMLCQFPATVSFVVDGLFTPSKLRLRPRTLAGEGITDNPDEARHKGMLLGNPGSVTTIAGVGWQPSVDVVFGACHAKVIRRDILGRPRRNSTTKLPTCWEG